MLRNPSRYQLTDKESFEAAFDGDALRFVVQHPVTGREVELVPGGRRMVVRWGDGSALRYAEAMEQYRLHEFDAQIRALCRGIASVVPILPLTLFNSRQLEVLCTGTNEVDIDLVSACNTHTCTFCFVRLIAMCAVLCCQLRDRTEYRGNLGPNDRHVKLFWNVLKGFSNDDRKRFLQFVWYAAVCCLCALLVKSELSLCVCAAR
jgi:hypothetical protein